MAEWGRHGAGNGDVRSFSRPRDSGGAVLGDGTAGALWHGRWESSYGEHFYNVVAKLRNDGPKALRWAKLRLDAVDKAGKVVASTETYNESAGALAVSDLSQAEKDALRTRLKRWGPAPRRRSAPASSATRRRRSRRTV